MAVTGAFFQATQPVSAAALPLPTGAAQEAGGNLAAVASAAGTQADAAYAGGSVASIVGALKGIFGKLAGTLTVNDANNASIQGAVAMSAGQTYSAGRQVGVDAATAGYVTFTLANGSTLNWPVSPGGETFSWAVTKWTLPAQNAASINQIVCLS